MSKMFTHRSVLLHFLSVCLYNNDRQIRSNLRSALKITATKAGNRETLESITTAHYSEIHNG